METIQGIDRSDRIIRKCQRIAGLKALLEEWELSDNLDLDYIRGLKARLLSVQDQLKDISGRVNRLDDETHHPSLTLEADTR